MPKLPGVAPSCVGLHLIVKELAILPPGANAGRTDVGSIPA
jgi:hypothetical protein